jgi:hypothetical protein
VELKILQSQRPGACLETVSILTLPNNPNERAAVGANAGLQNRSRIDKG